MSEISELRFDLIGINSIHGEDLSPKENLPYEVRLRVTGRANSMRTAALVHREVEALYTNGPAGGGGVQGSTREIIAMASVLIPRELVSHQIHFEVS